MNTSSYYGTYNKYKLVNNFSEGTKDSINKEWSFASFSKILLCLFPHLHRDQPHQHVLKFIIC